ncbi:MAG: DMT family transporter [Bacteroidia bacterium]
MSNKLKVHLSLFIVTLIYGATFTIAKEVMPVYVKPFAFIILRIWTAVIFIFIFHRMYVKEIVRDKKDLIKLFVCSVFGVLANMLLFFKGLSLTVPINGAVLMMNTPIFVVVFATFYLKEKLSVQKISGIMIAAVGAILLMGGTKISFQSETVAGDLMVTANAIIYAFYLVYVTPLTQKYHPLTITLYTFLFGAVLVIPFGWNEFTQIEWNSIPTKIYLFILFVTIGATFVTYALNAYALKHASPSIVGSYIYLQPVLATMIAIFSGRDFLSLQKMIFIIIIFTGVYLVSKKKLIKV